MKTLGNHYQALGPAFVSTENPTPVRRPQLLLFNEELVEELGLLENGPRPQDEQLARYFSGNELMPGSSPVAIAYAGHQFGNFVPVLGDGRAHLLGDLKDRTGTWRELQLKGSGATRFSRGGDGRCALGPAVREYLMGEAMHALGVPTSRSLAVVTTGEPVYREEVLPGAVVTRCARSHVRVGTFEYFGARSDRESLRVLMDHVLERLYPKIDSEGEQATLDFFEAHLQRQAKLVAEWMRVGFVHGVMNTDNVSIAGETIDFGPCAMMGVYSPKTVFSSIDRFGRYAFGNQPKIAQWNLAVLAQNLIPLFENVEQASEQLLDKVHGFPKVFEEIWRTTLLGKIGIDPTQSEPEDSALVESLLERMETERLDYTVTFDWLTQWQSESDSVSEQENPALAPWRKRWHERLGRQAQPKDTVFARMRAHNPAVIPRNHQVEHVLRAYLEGDPKPGEAFLKAIRAPYQVDAGMASYQQPPADNDTGYRTFCGT